jgi:hypothetical protein
MLAEITIRSERVHKWSDIVTEVVPFAENAETLNTFLQFLLHYRRTAIREDL